MREFRNKKLRNWIAKDPRNFLAFMINNNGPGVLAYLQSKYTIADLNKNGNIESGELYQALLKFAETREGGIKTVIAEIGAAVKHNDNAPSKWNLFRA